MADNLIAVGDRAPRVHGTAFVDPSARIMGEVNLAAEVGVWAGSVVRGDDDSVDIGAGSVILERCIVEAPEGRPVSVGPRCLISHGAILHGCRVEEGALVGIGAIVLDGAVVGRDAVVGAGSVVTPGTHLPPGVLALGTPARVVRELRPAERREVEAELARVVAKGAVYRRIFYPDD